MMKGKLMKSLFRGKGVPRTPGPPSIEVTEEGGDVGRLRAHSSEENNSTHSLDSPSSDSPRSWPSTFATPMSYIKGKKRKNSRFLITSPLELDKSDDVFGVEEHNLSQSIHSDAVSFVSFNDSPAGGEEEHDGAAASKRRQNGHQVEVQQLRLQLEVHQKMIAEYEKEKSKYEERLSGLAVEMGRKAEEARLLREEVAAKKRLEILLQDMREKLHHLESENRNLQQRVNEASPLTDHQKELLLQNRIKSCSAPPSIMAGSLEGAPGGLAGSGEELGSEWEVKSCGGSSVHSQVSVACLQDKLVQMEENNYSTHEELQATLQELTDLQHQLEELQSENRTLGDEKSLLYESLCEQTEKLEACRNQLESTRQLLLQKEDCAKMDNPEREKKLLDVLKSAQDERDRLDQKSKSLAAVVDDLRAGAEQSSREMSQVQERMSLLERTIHTVRMEKEHAERELIDLNNDLSCKNIELARLMTLNENFKTKLEELEAARDAVDKTDIEAKLDELRREKDGLETALAETSQERDRAEFQVGKVKEAATLHRQDLELQLQAKAEEIEHLKVKAGKLAEDKNNLLLSVQELQNTVTELEVKCQHHLSDKRELRSSLSELQKGNSEMQSRLSELECQLNAERSRHVSAAEDWEQYKADLLTIVRVANDFQTEAQSNLEVVISETSELREKIRQLEVENDKLKVAATRSQAVRSTNIPTHTSNSQLPVAEGISSLRQKYLTRGQDNKATVKGLIESIESAAKAHYTRSSSAPAMPTLSPISENPAKPAFVSASPIPTSHKELATVVPSVESDSPVSILANKNPPPRQPRLTFDSSTLGSGDPLAALVKNGGSKRNALLKWCQAKTAGYVDVDITNFSSSWNDGMAFCALLHTYIPDKIPYATLKPSEKRRNFTIAFEAAESVGIQNMLNLTEMVSIERPDWQQIMTYVTNIYKYFET